jgi:hypothetical protein
MTDDASCLHLRSAQTGLGVCSKTKNAGSGERPSRLRTRAGRTLSTTTIATHVKWHNRFEYGNCAMKFPEQFAHTQFCPQRQTPAIDLDQMGTRCVVECVLLGANRRGVFSARLLRFYDYGFDRSRGGNDRLVQLFNIGKRASTTSVTRLNAISPRPTMNRMSSCQYVMQKTDRQPRI